MGPRPADPEGLEVGLFAMSLGTRRPLNRWAFRPEPANAEVCVGVIAARVGRFKRTMRQPPSLRNRNRAFAVASRWLV